MKKETCCYCSGNNVIKIDTYKHIWNLCADCGNAYSKHKSRYLFEYLPYGPLKRNIDVLEKPGKMYDYFVSDAHKKYVINHASEFIGEFLNKNKISLEGKKVLDISGGSGHFINEFKKYGADIYLTEINDNAIEYAQKELGIKTKKFDFEKDSLEKLFEEKFDIVLLGAAIMFCKDIPKFLKDIKKVLNTDGLVIQHRCVEPTLGVLLRTQCDDYSYQVLYQPDTIVDIHKKEGFEVLVIEKETDPSLYVYDHDYNVVLRGLFLLYEYLGVRKLLKTDKFPFRARDRRRAHMIFKYSRVSD